MVLQKRLLTGQPIPPMYFYLATHGDDRSSATVFWLGYPALQYQIEVYNRTENLVETNHRTASRTMRFLAMKPGMTYDIALRAVLDGDYSEPLLETYTVPSYKSRT